MRTNIKTLLLATSAALAGFGAMSTVALAQVEEIIVESQKRAQNVQDVPIAVTAITAEDLEEKKVNDTADLQRVAPGLLIQSSNTESGGSTIRIRGVGTTGNNPGLEGAVGTFIDGVYRSRPGIVMNDIFDLQRVEVLRGPQGTLFGKNTSAGAITVVTNRADTDEFEANAEASYGNYNAIQLKGMVNVPLAAGKAGLRIAGTIHERDGFVENVVAPFGELNDRDRKLARASLRLDPSDSVRWDIILDYAQKDEKCCASVMSRNGPTSAAGASLGGVFFPSATTVFADPYNFKTANDRPVTEETTDYGATSEISWDINGIELKNISAYRYFENHNDIDADFQGFDGIYQIIDGEQDFISTEFQLTGTWKSLDWLIGAYYANEKIDNLSQTLAGAELGRFFNLITAGALGGLLAGASPADVDAAYLEGTGSTNAFSQEGDTFALFTHNVFSVTENFDVTIGLRYSAESKDATGRFTLNTPICADAAVAAVPALAGVRFQCDPVPVPPGFTTRDFDTSRDEDAVTGTFVLSYKWTDDINTYASYSRGYKSGGINLDRDAQVQPTPVLQFEPEEVDAYELGFKSTMFGRRLQLNAAAYYNEFEQFQLNSFTGLGFIISNAAGVESYGGEIETIWAPVDYFLGNLNVAFNESQYTDDTTVACGRTPNGGAANTTLTCAGQRITNAPKWIVQAGGNWTAPLPNTSLVGFLNLNANFRSSYNTGSDLDPPKRQPSFTTIDGRLGVGNVGDTWEVYLWGKNITDENYQAIAFDTVGQSNSFSQFNGAPQTFGIAVKASF